MATESFFTQSSLAYVASAAAGKDGKAYSIKPSDGTGDFTFSRGSNLAATRVGPSGLIEKGRENLLTHSNTFSNAAWTKSSTSVTAGQADKDGGSDAWLLEATISTASRIERSTGITGVATLSFFGKSGTTDWVRLNGGNSAVWFDLSNGTIGTLQSFNLIDYSIEEVAPGWYRCVLVTDAPSFFRIYPANSDGANAIAGDNIYIQDAQLEIGLAATDYIESGASTGKAGLLEDEPRFDYSGGATCPSLLLEPSRTNLLNFSEYFGGWSTVGGTPTRTPNAATSPEGIDNAYALSNTSGSASRIRNQNLVATSGDKFVISMFAKENAGSTFEIRHQTASNISVVFDLSDQSYTGGGTWVDDVDFVNYGNGWYRCLIYVTAAATQTGTIEIELANNASIFAYGFMGEAGSYPTSYIPNHSGGSVTRGEDGFSGAQDLTGIFTDSSQGTIYFEIEDLGHRSSGAGAVFRYGSATDNLQMAIYVDNNGVKFYFYNKGAFLISANTDVGSTYKFAIVFNGTSLTGFRNTTKYGPLTDDETFDVTRVTDMNFETNSVKLKQLLYFPEALSDADCITLTTI